MGDEADDILSSLGLSADDKKSYDTVKTKLEGHFVKQKTLFMNERASTKGSKNRVKA